MIFFVLFYFFVFLPFLGPLPRHTEVPRLGVKSELQPLAYTTATAMRDLSLGCNPKKTKTKTKKKTQKETVIFPLTA